MRTFTPEDVDRFERLLYAAQDVVNDAESQGLRFDSGVVGVDAEIMDALRARVREISDAAVEMIKAIQAEPALEGQDPDCPVCMSFERCEAHEGNEA